MAAASIEPFWGGSTLL